MPLSSKLAPGFIRLRYSGVVQPHTQVIPIQPASPMIPGVEPTLLTTSGSEVLFDAAITNYVSVALREQLNTATTIGFADIYAVNAETGERTFIYTVNIAGTGNSATAAVGQVEAVWVYKTTVGNPLKVYVMEGVYSPDVRNVGVVPADGRQDMNDYILGDTNIFYGRENAWPLAFMTFTTKVNDVLRRRQGFTDI